jgi:hypothetical protein
MKSALPKDFPDQDFGSRGGRPLPFDYPWRCEDGMSTGYRQVETEWHNAAEGGSDDANAGWRARSARGKFKRISRKK